MDEYMKLDKLMDYYEEARKVNSEGKYQRTLFHVHTPKSHDYARFFWEEGGPKRSKEWTWVMRFLRDSLKISGRYIEQLANINSKSVIETEPDVNLHGTDNLIELAMFVELAKDLLDTKVAIIVVTDHNTFGGDNILRSIMKKIAFRDETTIPSVIPGIEISAMEKFHVVGIFKNDKDINKLYNQLSGKLDEQGANATAIDILESIRKSGGIGYIAHLNTHEFIRDVQASGLSGGYQNKLMAGGYLNLFGVNSAEKANDISQVLKGRFRKYNGDFHFIVDADLHHGSEFQEYKVTWVKAQRGSFNEIKQAFLDPDISLATRNLEKPDYWIEMVAFTNSFSFMGGNSYPFSASMTSVIGARGTGKSTLIKYLRMVLTQEFKEDDHFNELLHLMRQGSSLIVLNLENKRYLLKFEGKYSHNEIGIGEIVSNSTMDYRKGRSSVVSAEDVKKAIRRHITLFDLTELVNSSLQPVRGVEKSRLLKNISNIFRQMYTLNQLSSENSVRKILLNQMENKPNLVSAHTLKNREFAEALEKMTRSYEKVKSFYLEFLSNLEANNSDMKFTLKESYTAHFEFDSQFKVPDPYMDLILSFLDTVDWHRFYQCNDDSKNNLVTQWVNSNAYDELWISTNKTDSLAVNDKKQSVDGMLKYLRKNEKKAIELLHDEFVEKLQIRINSNVSMNTEQPMFREFSSLSSGQKTVTALNLILSLAAVSNVKMPLFLDQPEDYLDSRYIYSVLAPKIKEFKKKNQIVVVTHNSTIVTRAKSELVLAIDVELGKSKILKGGYLSDIGVLKRVVSLLEGGESSFLYKLQLYSQVFGSKIVEALSSTR